MTDQASHPNSDALSRNTRRVGRKKSPRIDIGNLLFQNNMMIIFVEQLIRGSNTYLVFANLL